MRIDPLPDRPPLVLHAITRAADVQPDHTPTKGLVQHFGIARIIAEVGDNQRIVVMSAINCRERARARAATQPLRQLFAVR